MRNLIDRRQNRHIVHAHSLSRHSVWLQWHMNTKGFDLSWKNLIYGPRPSIISFVLNSSINSLKTPDLIKTWGFKSHANCFLCDSKQCTQHHILVGCKTALKEHRYTWRHDSVLKQVETWLQEHIKNGPYIKPNRHARPWPAIMSTFEREKPKDYVEPDRKLHKRNKPKVKSILPEAKNWKLLADYRTNPKSVFFKHHCNKRKT